MLYTQDKNSGSLMPVMPHDQLNASKTKLHEHIMKAVDCLVLYFLPIMILVLIQPCLFSLHP